jgi:hypothetical protein
MLQREIEARLGKIWEQQKEIRELEHMWQKSNKPMDKKILNVIGFINSQLTNIAEVVIEMAENYANLLDKEELTIPEEWELRFYIDTFAKLQNTLTPIFGLLSTYAPFISDKQREELLNKFFALYNFLDELNGGGEISDAQSNMG